MSELEHELEALGTRLDVPRQDLRIPVRAGILEGRQRRRRREQLLVVTGMLAVALTPAVAIPASRDAILQLLGARNGASVRELQPPPARAPANTVGTPATVTSATRLASFRVLLPRGLRADGVYLGSGVAGDMVTLLFHSNGMRLRLTEFRGRDPSAANGERVDVAGRAGVWLEPAGRFSFTDVAGARRDFAQAPVGNALVWQRGPLTLQLQATRLTRPTALAFARSVA
jgi:hypothetical protein